MMDASPATRFALLMLLGVTGCGVMPNEPAPAVSEHARRLHHNALVVDGHNDVASFMLDLGFDLGMNGSGAGKRDATAYWVPGLRWLAEIPADQLKTDTDLVRLQEGGVDALFFSIFAHSSYAKTPGASRQRALDMIDVLREQLRRHSEELELATTAADVRRISADGRIAALMGLEGGHAIENDLDVLREFHQLGVRYMTLTWENPTSWADSCYAQPNGGLTAFGREVVREMNRLGMLVDVSHVSDQTFFDALETTSAPVIASHSSARALVDHARNMTDDMLRAMTRNGGVVMVNAQDVFIDPAKSSVPKALFQILLHGARWPRSALSQYVDHIDHVARVAGIDHVGLGSDFAGTIFHPEGLTDVGDFPNVTQALLDRGYTDVSIRKILGENVLRVMAEAERKAHRSQSPEPE